jgi:hypothetical protein
VNTRPITVKPLKPKNLKAIVAHVFASSGHEPYFATQATRGRSSLLEICQQIFSTSFGVYDLSTADLNIYLEMGIALGLNQPIVAIAQETVPLPSMLKGHDVIVFTNHTDLYTKLVALRDRGFPPTAQSAPDHCYFCGHVCPSMSTPPEENTYLVLHHSKLLWRNLMRSLEPYLAKYNLHPIYLTDRASGSTLCDIRQKVLSSQFALCHIGKLSNESSFLALGMAIGSRVPWVLLSEKSNGAIPPDLREADKIEYETPDDLEARLTDTLGVFLGRIIPGSAPKGVQIKTAALSLPFWLQLQDWLSRTARTTQASGDVQGEIRLAHYEGQKDKARHSVPDRGLLVGRISDCNVVVENQSVSAHHFRILKGRTGKYFVQDLQSKNGTFLNGSRLPAGKRVQIQLKDTIRIPGAQFLVWDDRPLPQETSSQPPSGVGLFQSLQKIELPDVPPPAYLSTWDRSIVLTVIHPNGNHRSRFEVQAYYPIGRILDNVIDLLGLPKNGYCFKIENKVIGNDETPLSAGIKRGDLLRIIPTGANTR